MPQRRLRDLGRLRGSTRTAGKGCKKQRSKLSSQSANASELSQRSNPSPDVSQLAETPVVHVATTGDRTSEPITESCDMLPPSPLAAPPDYLQKYLHSIQPDPDYMRWLETRHASIARDEHRERNVSRSNPDEAYERALDCWFPLPDGAPHRDSQ